MLLLYLKKYKHFFTRYYVYFNGTKSPCVSVRQYFKYFDIVLFNSELLYKAKKRMLSVVW